ncbi:hypothetical protein TraAM80_08606 [Trypanosoma rangeli]|uniref:Uncharacterized protein n=1 Tax=Trypanosoma rangeli TaxID=5698 RepID=A0A422MZX2_TRYRA|nr:uncharacterized protein TraAM80_08606 [Trypanosoma rangeli]RNE98759.1 hypothetical protein TraAM80_08606 [Trypanosoma rangeli]|eukprot:RNE98759.1 hypothetical protein TraAM80_08606 [Trypanosoma rangeli]
METVAELCALCTAGDGPAGTPLDSVLSFVAQRAARMALPYMSAVERGTLTLQLISAGGLQHGACRQLLFQELSPPYSTAAIVRRSHELYIKAAERTLALDDNVNATMVSQRSRGTLPHLSLLRKSLSAERNLPSVEFRGEDAERLLSALLLSWNLSNVASPSPHTWLLEDIPPGLATYLTLHCPARTLQLLRTTIVGLSVPQTWRELWRHVFVFAPDADATVDTMHGLLNEGICADFWPLATRVFVHPLAGAVGDDGAEKDQLATLEGPSTFLTHALLCMWLGEIKHECDMTGLEAPPAETEVVKEASSFSVPPLLSSSLQSASAVVDVSWRRALMYGLRLVEMDGACDSHGEPQRKCAGAVQAAYGLLLSLYHGHSMASHYVRGALDHPDVTLFVPSFEDLNGAIREGDQCSGGEGHCGSSAFLAALALRLPAAQLYIAERVWRQLETLATPGEAETRERQVAEVDARLRVLLNSFACSDLPLETTQERRGTSAPLVDATATALGEGLQKREDTPRLTMRLKRTRAEEPIPHPRGTSGKDGANHNSQTRMPPTTSDIALATSLLRNALIDFAAEEIALSLTSPNSLTLVSAFAAAQDGRLSASTARLVLVMPPHMKSFVGLFSAFASSSSCSLVVHDVCCVVMSVLLYRQCYALQSWLLREAKNGLKAAVVGHFVWRVRRWLRFLAPLGVFRYTPVADVLLPECLREMARQEAKSTDYGSDASVSAFLEELCGAVMSAL